MIAPFLASSSVNLFKPQYISPLRLIIDHNSTKRKDLFIHGYISVTLYSKKLTFRDTNRSFKLDGDLSKTMTIYKLKVGHSNPQDRKIIYELEKNELLYWRYRTTKYWRYIYDEITYFTCYHGFRKFNYLLIVWP